MTVLTNNAEGGTDGVSVSTGNSGGGSGDAFDNVNNSPVYTTTDPLNELTSILCDGSASDYVGWTSSMPSSNEGWLRVVGKLSALPGANASICEIRESNGTTVGTDIRITPSGQIQLRPSFVAEFVSSALITAGTIFRLEVHILSSATVGKLEGRVFLGANVWGETPDSLIGDWSQNHNTGDGTIGGFTTGWISNPSGNPDLRIDEIGYSDEDWLGSPVTPVVQAGFGSVFGMLSQGVSVPVTPPSSSDILVPDTGAWFGCTTAAVATDGGSTSTVGLAEWIAAVSRPHIISIYKTNAWNGVFTSAENNWFDPAGDKHAIPLLHWKINSGGATWADVAAGLRDSDIINFANGIKQYPRKCFMSFFHEPEDNVGSNGMTKADYIGMWRRARDICDAQGVTNLVYVIQYIGYSGDAENANGKGFEDMYPGDDYVDWIGWDPYNKANPSRTSWAQIVNETIQGPSGYSGFYNWAQANHPSKPLMVAETGAGIEFNNSMTVQEAANCYTGWAVDTPDFPAIKAVVFWNSKATYDYFITKSGRGAAAAAVKAWSEIPWFDQDPDLAP